MRITVGAHYGLRDWIIQRVTAVIMAVYTLVILAALLFGGIAQTAERWQGFFASGWVRLISFLFVVSLCYHAWIGIRDIWMDYIKPVWVRLSLHALTLLALVGYAGWAIEILWRR